MSWREQMPPVEEERIASVTETEVVVVGLGYAGTAALRAAREAGGACVGLEHQRRERYNLFGRDVGHINSAFLAARGVPAVEPMDLYGEWMRRAGNRAHPALVRAFCEKSGAAFDWYTDMLGPEGLRDVHVAYWPGGGTRFKQAVLEGKNDLNGYRFWNGTAQFPDPMGWPGRPYLPEVAMANIQKAEALGAETRFGWTADRLETAAGRVTGVLARDGAGAYHRLIARRGVILAAGDFSGSSEMVRELCPDVDDLTPPDRPARGMGRDGSGVRMGLWAGGALESRPVPVMGGNGVIPMDMCPFGAVWFDQDGRRFCNEVFGGPEIGGFAGNQSGIREVLVVFDEHMLENELTWAVPAHGGFDENIEGLADNLRALICHACAGGPQPFEAKLKPPLGRQRAFYGADPETLARNAGLDEGAARGLCRGIERYNELCRQGRDRDFGRDPRVLDPLTDMLFLQRVPLDTLGPIMVTVGGLLTDGEQRVLDGRQEPIGGLFATGNCCGRRFGSQYSTPISGVSIGMAITLGREAGETAAREEGGECI